jgi:hypothetical protein
VHEIDILAVRCDGEQTECRHIEVQASMRPISYICRVPKAEQRRGRAAISARRTAEELRIGIEEWVAARSQNPRKQDLQGKLVPGGEWTRELVIHRVKSADEVRGIRAHGIAILHLSSILREVRHSRFMLGSAGGSDVLDFLNAGSELEQPGDPIDAAVYRAGA